MLFRSSFSLGTRSEEFDESKSRTSKCLVVFSFLDIFFDFRICCFWIRFTYYDVLILSYFSDSMFGFQPSGNLEINKFRIESFGFPTFNYSLWDKVTFFLATFTQFF